MIIFHLSFVSFHLPLAFVIGMVVGRPDGLGSEAKRLLTRGI
jgi:hypothetical protein